ncbi:hypothetical protein K3495_g7097 [Podosphaera aphanis]|nr:hypothetical protein K3495_g7097 [Podosphaera aphanis]
MGSSKKKLNLYLQGLGLCSKMQARTIPRAHNRAAPPEAEKQRAQHQLDSPQITKSSAMLKLSRNLVTILSAQEASSTVETEAQRDITGSATNTIYGTGKIPTNALP